MADPNPNPNRRRPPRANGDGIDADGLGERIRETRAELGFSLREMARRLDVSPSLVSQIETGKIHPSVRTLYAIVGELGVSLDDLFSSGPIARQASEDRRRPEAAREGGPTGGFVQRAEDRSAIDLETGVRWERLTTRHERDVEFLFTVYPPGSESAPEDALIQHNGREFGIVLGGRLSVTIGFEDHVLEPGDSVSFESTTPHRLHNDGDEPVTAVWFVVDRRPSNVQ